MEIRYPVLPKEQSREVRCAIRRVFVDVWDPIGVISDPDWPRDEYDGYMGRVLELLVNGGGDDELVRYLDWVVARMGMDGSRVSLHSVVAALRQIPIPGK